MLGAHFDSWHAGTGATDNGAGCALILEALRILKALDLKMAGPFGWPSGVVRNRDCTVPALTFASILVIPSAWPSSPNMPGSAAT
jgi:hypothetical protein